MFVLILRNIKGKHSSGNWKWLYFAKEKRTLSLRKGTGSLVHTSLTHGDLVDGTVPNKVNTEVLGFVGPEGATLTEQ